MICSKVFVNVRDLYNFQFSSAIDHTLSWTKFYGNVAAIQKISRFKLVRWFRPNEEFLKLNTDSYLKGNPYCACGRGVLPNSNGTFLLTFSYSFGEVTSIQAEL